MKAFNQTRSFAIHQHSKSKWYAALVQSFFLNHGGTNYDGIDKLKAYHYFDTNQTKNIQFNCKIDKYNSFRPSD